MHQDQVNFCNKVRENNPDFFEGTNVLDVGSMNINGDNRYLFTDCNYTGLDIGEGDNVDIICKVHEYFTPDLYDVVMSTEMLEHDIHWKDSLIRMYELLRPGGLMLITAAHTGRPEHGTREEHSWCSPYTNDYYKNITVDMVNEAFENLPFERFEITHNDIGDDIYIEAIK